MLSEVTNTAMLTEKGKETKELALTEETNITMLTEKGELTNTIMVKEW